MRDGSVSIGRGGVSDWDSGDGAASAGGNWPNGLAEYSACQGYNSKTEIMSAM